MGSLKGRKLDRFVTKGGKKLRYGYTTGSCAAASAKASTKILFTKERVEEINIDTPKGWELKLPVEVIVIKDDYVSCCIIKDSGDDPDITNGIKVYSKVKKTNSGKVEVIGGIGVGKVTKAGLAVPIGKYAINPVPMEMIKKEVSKVLPEGEGVLVEIHIPEGVEIGKRTFNPRLGIVGGISILGTTGIVEPMSEEAMKESLALELSMLKEKGIKKVIFVPGNYGRDFAKDLLGSNIDGIIVKTSNFIGYMLDKAVENEMEEILFIGHIGKMVKVAGGIFHTHSKIADGRMDVLAANCGLLGCSKEVNENIMNSGTTDEAIHYIKEEGLEDVFTLIAEKISSKSSQRGYDEIKIGTLIFSNKYGQLGVCPTGKKMLEEFRNE